MKNHILPVGLVLALFNTIPVANAQTPFDAPPPRQVPNGTAPNYQTPPNAFLPNFQAAPNGSGRVTPMYPNGNGPIDPPNGSGPVFQTVPNGGGLMYQVVPNGGGLMYQVVPNGVVATRPTSPPHAAGPNCDCDHGGCTHGGRHRSCWECFKTWLCYKPSPELSCPCAPYFNQCYPPNIQYFRLPTPSPGATPGNNNPPPSCQNCYLNRP